MKSKTGVLENQRFLEKFHARDTVHWKEAIWTDRPLYGKPRAAGEQEVTGQIVHITEKTANIMILSAKITDIRLPVSSQSELVAYEVGKIISKRISTLIKGGIEKIPD